ncbi:YdcH family protein [Ensifer soli]|uniref:YdcH family protein n=1 Tax=Ciceribacter sp. sgz301302 TaxID=3342379 RepID=UPI0035BADA35
MNIEAHLATLEKRHGALEEALHNALKQPSAADQEIADIKRRKLRIKDEIEKIRSSIH